MVWSMALRLRRLAIRPTIGSPILVAFRHVAGSATFGGSDRTG